MQPSGQGHDYTPEHPLLPKALSRLPRGCITRVQGPKLSYNSSLGIQLRVPRRCLVVVYLTLGNWLLYPQKICQLEPEGCVKVELVLRAAEALLATCQEAQKPEILAQLRDIKSQWEETVTYMTHCHRWGCSDARDLPFPSPHHLGTPV